MSSKSFFKKLYRSKNFAKYGPLLIFIPYTTFVIRNRMDYNNQKAKENQLEYVKVDEIDTNAK